jgi:hypothetical protein
VFRTFILRQAIHAAALHAFLKANAGACAKAGKPLAVDVYEHKAKRSSQANRRYWAILRFIAENAWLAGRQFSDECWHEHYKRKFIGLVELPNGGTAGISTTTLDVGAFAEYTRNIELDAATTLGLEMEQFQ